MYIVCITHITIDYYNSSLNASRDNIFNKIYIWYYETLIEYIVTSALLSTIFNFHPQSISFKYRIEADRWIAEKITKTTL